MEANKATNIKNEVIIDEAFEQAINEVTKKREKLKKKITKLLKKEIKQKKLELTNEKIENVEKLKELVEEKRLDMTVIFEKILSKLFNVEVLIFSTAFNILLERIIEEDSIKDEFELYVSMLVKLSDEIEDVIEDLKRFYNFDSTELEKIIVRAFGKLLAITINFENVEKEIEIEKIFWLLLYGYPIMEINDNLLKIAIKFYEKDNKYIEKSCKLFYKENNNKEIKTFIDFDSVDDLSNFLEILQKTKVLKDKVKVILKSYVSYF